MNRREFLGASGAGLVAAGVASATPRVPAGPNDMLHIGIVGPGGRGTSLMKECIESGKLQNARLTAVFGPTHPLRKCPPGATWAWGDEDVYDPGYELSGRIPRGEYFHKLTARDILAARGKLPLSG